MVSPWRRSFRSLGVYLLSDAAVSMAVVPSGMGLLIHGVLPGNGVDLVAQCMVVLVLRGRGLLLYLLLLTVPHVLLGALLVLGAGAFAF